jgi:hypothetical protein
MSTKKINRNAPCECGSGKKYKRCCWIAANSNDLQLSAVDVSVHEAIEAATATTGPGVCRKRKISTTVCFRSRLATPMRCICQARYYIKGAITKPRLH